MSVEAYVALGIQVLFLISAVVKLHNSITTKIGETNSKIEIKHIETMGEISLIQKDIKYLRENGVSALATGLKECKEYRNEVFDEVRNGIKENRENIIKLKEAKK